jgi:EAL domain-containing protein (putative c-di-GMP-specific phosphodiesterase class I)
MRDVGAKAHCGACQTVEPEPFPFSMAFQPIVDVETGAVYAYEALVRGMREESAAEVLGKVTPSNRHAFDQHCKLKAVTLAARLDLAQTGARLSINVMPGVAHRTKDCSQRIMETAMKLGFPCEQIIFEMSETQHPRNQVQMVDMVDEYRRCGFLMAIDDFGDGYSGLSRLAEMPMDIIKIDMKLVRNLAQRRPAQAVVKCLVALAKSLGCQLVAEGIETVEEHDALCACGVRLMQGYLFAMPGFETLPQIKLPCAKRLDIAA